MTKFRFFQKKKLESDKKGFLWRTLSLFTSLSWWHGGKGHIAISSLGLKGDAALMYSNYLYLKDISSWAFFECRRMLIILLKVWMLQTSVSINDCHFEISTDVLHDIDMHAFYTWLVSLPTPNPLLILENWVGIHPIIPSFIKVTGT